jgi:hypothetical protein
MSKTVDQINEYLRLQRLEREKKLKEEIEARARVECRYSPGELQAATVAGALAGGFNGVRLGGVAGAAGGSITGMAIGAGAEAIRQYGTTAACKEKIAVEETAKSAKPVAAPPPVIMRTRTLAGPSYASAGRDAMMGSMLRSRMF